MALPLLLGLILGGALLVALLLWRAALAVRHGNSLVSSADLIGQVGRLRLPCGPRQQRGLVRLTVRGTLIDVPAYSVEGPLARGLAVMVIDQRGSDVWVQPLPPRRNAPPVDPFPHG